MNGDAAHEDTAYKKEGKFWEGGRWDWVSFKNHWIEAELPLHYPDRNIEQPLLIWNSGRRFNGRQTLGNHQGERCILVQHSRGWAENQEQTLPPSPVTSNSSSVGLSYLGHSNSNNGKRLRLEMQVVTKMKWDGTCNVECLVLKCKLSRAAGVLERGGRHQQVRWDFPKKEGGVRGEDGVKQGKKPSKNLKRSNQRGKMRARRVSHRNEWPTWRNS